jgi:hypothetical protein
MSSQDESRNSATGLTVVPGAAPTAAAAVATAVVTPGTDEITPSEVQPPGDVPIKFRKKKYRGRKKPRSQRAGGTDRFVQHC